MYYTNSVFLAQIQILLLVCFNISTQNPDDVTDVKSAMTDFGFKAGKQASYHYNQRLITLIRKLLHPLHMKESSGQFGHILSAETKTM